jgi:CheY-like chemotaxis protein
VQHGLRRKPPAGGRQARFGVIPVFTSGILSINSPLPKATYPPAYPVAPIVPKAVLFLDDEQSYVELMTQLLSDNLDCPILPYTRPHEALAALPRLDVAMIVTDYSMSPMNGIDFLYRAHAVRPQIAAMMITGHRIELEDKDLSHVPGLRATLFKPISWRMLAENIIKHWPDPNPPVLR